MTYLHLDSWAGRTKTPVKIIKTLIKRYKIEFLADCLKGKKGQIKSVPKYAVSEE